MLGVSLSLASQISFVTAFPQLLSGEQLSFLLLSGGVEPPDWSTALRIYRRHQLLVCVAPTVLTATRDHAEYLRVFNSACW